MPEQPGLDGVAAQQHLRRMKKGGSDDDKDKERKYCNFYDIVNDEYEVEREGQMKCGGCFTYCLPHA